VREENGRAQGTVKFWKGDLGWGFIRPDEHGDGKDVFVHKSQIGTLPFLQPDQRVSYVVRQKPGKGSYASEVQLVS